jgi:fructose-bisphosphate aldolase, class I
MATIEATRPRLKDLDLPIGKRTRLYQLLYKYGPANGTMLVLPIDQGLEHGPRDFFPNPDSADPDYQLRVAREGNFSAIAFQVGVAEKHMGHFPDVPLILKLNGKTEIPSAPDPISSLNATVEDALRLGAVAIGYTLYVGTPRQHEDFLQFAKVRAAADRYGMPVIVWAYPRGEAVDKKGGRDGLYAIDYAARTAYELGADVIKLNMPKVDEASLQASPKEYGELAGITQEEAMRMVVKSCQRAFCLLSGGSKVSDEDLLEKVHIAMRAGATGLIFGRNVWQRPFDEATGIARRIHEVLAQYGDDGAQ